jgi:hypothetical protein
MILAGRRCFGAAGDRPNPQRHFPFILSEAV